MIDDVWMTCGSDNFNRRSWTNDSEISCAVLDTELDEREPRDLTGRGEGARRLPRSLRLQLWGEHLGRDAGDPELLDPACAFDLWLRTAEARDAWHEGGRRGPRPPGQVRRHRPAPVTSLERLWAEPLARVLYDPDGRPLRLRLRNRL